MTDSPPLPVDVLPCLSGDVLLVPYGQLTIRLTSDARHWLIAGLFEVPRSTAYSHLKRPGA